MPLDIKPAEITDILKREIREYGREIDIAEWVKRLREKHRIAIDGGYGKLKGKTFRLSNMGDETKETITELLAALDDTLA